MGLLPRPLGIGARAASALLGLPVSTYTAALISNTAVPVWHEARRVLPFLFAGGAAASAGAAAMIVTPPRAAGAARRLAVGGAAAQLVATVAMERGLEERVGRPYREGKAQALGRLAKALTLGGGVAAAVVGRDRRGAIAAGAALTAGAVLERWSVFVAGSQSAADPQAVTQPQRAAMEGGDRRGSVRVEVRAP